MTWNFWDLGAWIYFFTTSTSNFLTQMMQKDGPWPVVVIICVAIIVIGIASKGNWRWNFWNNDDDDDEPDVDLPYSGKGVYVVDVITEKSLKKTPDFPENTWTFYNMDDVAKCVHNCSSERSGIKQIRITVDKPHTDDQYETT